MYSVSIVTGRQVAVCVYCFYGYRRQIAVHGACRLYCVSMVTLRQVVVRV